MKKKLLAMIILVELVIIAALGLYIREKQKKVLSAVSVNPIAKETIVFKPQGQLKYFYELKASINSRDEKFTWLKEKPTYSINDDGLNERFNYSFDKPEKTFRIVAIGDSFTFGQFVNTQENWVELVEDFLNQPQNCGTKFEVLNLGVAGYDIQYASERFKSKGIKYNPDLVLWLLKNDDFDEVMEFTSPIKTRQVEALKVKGEYDDLAKSGTTKIYGDSLKQAVDEINEKFGPEQILNYQEAVLNDFADSYKGKLLIFNIMTFKPEYESKITNLITGNSNYVFANESFTSYDWKKNSFLPYDGHPSQEGHKIIARDLFNYLTENKIVACQ